MQATAVQRVTQPVAEAIPPAQAAKKSTIPPVVVNLREGTCTQYTDTYYNIYTGEVLWQEVYTVCDGDGGPGEGGDGGGSSGGGGSTGPGGGGGGGESSTPTQTSNPPLTIPKLINGECTGLTNALALQTANKVEVKGFVTLDGTVILLPMGANTINSTSVTWPIRDTSGNVITPEPYQEDGVWKITVNSYVNGIWVDPAPVYTIAYHFHTHPGPPYDPDAPSPADYALAGQYPGMTQKIVNANNIVEYNATCATSFTANNCH